MQLFKIMIFLSVFLATTGVLSADSMFCDYKLIKSGDTKGEVLIKCGEPILKENVGEKTVYKKFYNSIISTKVFVEKWTYDLGYGQFLRILTFEGDTLVKIELGDKP